MTKKRIATKITEPEEFLKEHVKQVACGENHTLFLTSMLLLVIMFFCFFHVEIALLLNNEEITRL